MSTTFTPPGGAGESPARRTPKLRVLMIDHTAVLSGGELAMLEFLRHCDRTQMECGVILGADGPLVEELRPSTEVSILPMNQWLLNTRKQALTGHNLRLVVHALAALPYIWTLSRAIRAWRPDVVHTNSLKSDLLGGLAARLARVPLVWHVRDRIAPDYLPAAAVVAFRMLCRLIPNAVVGCSQSVLDTLRLPVSRPGTVVYSGVVIEDFSPTLGAFAAETMAGEPKVVRVGLVGRLASWKGQHIFLEAAVLLRDRYPQLRFVLIGSAMFGDQDYADTLHRFVRDQELEPLVRFTGFVRDIPQQLQELDILVHASTSPEPFGQVIVQGMAACKPVIATMGGGASEIIRDGVDGLLIAGGDPKALAESIAKLLESPELAQRLAVAGRARAEATFSIQRTVQVLTGVFQAQAKRPSEPMKVLFYNITGRVSGGEVVLLNIVSRLPSTEFEPFVACPDGDLSERMRTIGQEPIVVPELSLRFTRNPFKLLLYFGSILRSVFAMRKVVQRIQPQVIHANSLRAGLMASAATAGWGTLVQWHVHDNLPPRLMSQGIRAAASVSRRNRFLTVSQSTASNLIGSLFGRFLHWRTFPLLNAVDSSFVPSDPSARAILCAELGIPERSTLIVHVGQIAPRKDQLGAVRAFHQFVQGGQAAVLLLIGSPVFEGGDAYLRKVQSEVHFLQLDVNVRFLGHRTDVSRIMGASDLVLLTSLHDPCPLTVLEAMAAGAPILASRIDGVPELIEEGRTGWLAEPGDPRAFGARMLEIFHLSPEERDVIGQSARVAVKHHSFASYMASFSAITRENYWSNATSRKRSADPMKSFTRSEPKHPSVRVAPLVDSSTTIRSGL